MAQQYTPRVHVSQWTGQDGQMVYQVMERGMPICGVLDNLNDAVHVYRMRWLNAGPGSDIWQCPPVYDGDQDRWIN